jgi:hypothetical protein
MEVSGMEARDIAVLGEYCGHRIRINPSDDMYVNATDMAKACGKLWGNYRQMQATAEFLDELSRSIGIPIDRLVMGVTTGPNNQRGTWVHRHVAIDFAQWLSPAFKVWCIQRLDELMRSGRVIIHREHQEAQLSQIVPLMERMLLKLDAQNQHMMHVQQQNQDVLSYSLEVLKQMRRSAPQRLEKLVAWQLQKQWGGVLSVPACNGLYEVDLLTDSRIVEIKIAKEWKHGFGQINLYRRYFPNQDPYLYLFARPLDSLPAEKKRQRIERECRNEGVAVSWHTWEIEIFERVQRQPFLPFSESKPERSDK